MGSQEFGRAVAFYHRIAHKLRAMSEAGGAPCLTISDPDDYISDAALDVYAGELKKKWTLQRTYYELQVPVYELYREAGAVSPDADVIGAKRDTLFTEVKGTADLLRQYALSPEYTAYEGALKQIAAAIEEVALPLNHPGPLIPSTMKQTAAQIGMVSGGIIQRVSHPIYAKLVESDGIAVFSKPETPDAAVDPNQPPQPTSDRVPKVG